MAKLLATELSDKVMYQCLQMFGGYGFMEEFKMARMYRDTRVGTIGGGSSEIMREIIAKTIIDDVGYQSASRNNSTVAREDNGNGQLEAVLDKIKDKAETAAVLGSTLKFDFGNEQLFIDGTGEKNVVSAENKDAECLGNASIAA